MKCVNLQDNKQLGIALRTVNILMKRNMENSPIIKEMDHATGMHGYIIGYLKRHENEEIFQRDVEKHFSIRRSTATAILQLMEKNGLIQRVAVEYDARLKKIVLTEKAERMVRLFDEERHRTEEILKKDLTEQQVELLLGLLKKMSENLIEYGLKEYE